MVPPPAAAGLSAEGQANLAAGSDSLAVQQQAQDSSADAVVAGAAGAAAFLAHSARAVLRVAAGQQWELLPLVVEEPLVEREQQLAAVAEAAEAAAQVWLGAAALLVAVPWVAVVGLLPEAVARPVAVACPAVEGTAALASVVADTDQQASAVEGRA